MRYIPTVYQDVNSNDDDFSREVFGELVIHKVKFTRATYKEAVEFKNNVIADIAENKLKIIIDLSLCDYIDSTFLGALVIMLKKISERGGEIKYVSPSPGALYLFKLTGLTGVFNLYRTAQDAIDSFEYPSIEALR